MKVTSNTFQSYIYSNWNKTHSFYNEKGKAISDYMVQRLIKYAFSRLDSDLVEMIVLKDWMCSVDRLCTSDNETLNDSTYQINFTNKRGIRISVDGILLKDYKPILDHGLSLDECQ